MANVLLASLGESPAVVPAMYDLLIHKKHVQIDSIDVLYPTGGYVTEGYELVKEVFAHDIARPDILQGCELKPLLDVNSEEDALNFLKTLYQTLETHQQSGDAVYLSLAGGRKSMSALMAWVAPFFPCVQGLFHIIDPRKSHEFPSVQQLYSWDDMTRRAAMRPDWHTLSLVTIPFGKEQYISQELHEKLLEGSVEELMNEGFDEEDVKLAKVISSNENILDVELTQHAVEQYLEYYKRDFQRARRFKSCFDEMRTPSFVRKGTHGSKKHKNITLHFFKKGRTVERPLFYTTPKDIYYSADNEVERVVVCALEVEKEDEYQSFEKLIASPHFSQEPKVSIEKLPIPKRDASDEKILIVPLGAAPMVATQLYVLGTEKEGWNIKQVVLIYPDDDTIVEGAEMVEVALREYKRKAGKKYQNDVRHISIHGLRDITSDEHCITYQDVLNQVLQEYSASYSPGQIILALSGGRKGMAAMSIFSAQKAKIRHVYHTLITDREVENDIIDETTVEALQDLRSDQERNHLLLLREYNQDGEYSQFTLFRMPVFPTGK